MRRHAREERRAEAFEDALAGRDVRDATLARESAELVLVAEAILRAEHPDPDPAFVTDLRERLLTEAADVLVADPRPVVHVRPVPHPERSVRRRAAALATAFVVAAGSFGLVGASAQAIPGEPLYPVKRGVEDVELALQRGPTGTGEKQLELAGERLAEVDALSSDDLDAREAALVDDALADFSRRARAGSQDLLTAYERRGSTRAVETLDQFVGTSTRTLDRIQPRLPGSSTGAFADATGVLGSISDDARQACSDCVSDSVADAVGDLLAGGVPTNDPATAPSGSPSGGPTPAPTPAPTATPAAPSAQPSGSAGSDRPGGAPSDLPSVRVPGSDAEDDDPPASAVPPRVRRPVRDLTDPLLEGILGTPSSSPTPTPGTETPGLLDGLLGGS